jgi:archaellum component FlaC
MENKMETDDIEKLKNKIKRLEKNIKTLRYEKEEIIKLLNNMRSSLSNEREWRKNFQKIIKSIVNEDDLDDLDYYYLTNI